MKKIITCILILAMCMSAFCACTQDGGSSSDALTSAKDYLYAMYKNDAVDTPSDYTLVSVINIGGVSYDVTWTVDVAEGVAISAPDGGKVTVDVNEKTEADIAYVLTAVITDANGKTESVTFNHRVPAFKELSWAEYVAAEDDSTVVVKGIVTGIMAKSKGNTSNCLYLQDSDGGYYVYNMEADPVEGGIAVGMTVRVSGTRDTYSGTYEIMNGAVEIVDDKTSVPEALDYTEIFTSASSLKDEALTAKQAMLVTIKGVEVTGQDTSSGYYKFKLGSLETYVRISSSVCPLTKDEQSVLISGHSEHLGWTANVTGVICIYDGAFYLTPVSADCFEYVSLPAKDDAGMVEFEAGSLSLPEAVTEDTTITLNTAGQSYSDVKIEWTSDSECAVISDGVLTITLPEEDTVVTITAVITCGEASQSVTFTINVDAAATDAYITAPVASPETDTAYKFALYQANLGKTLYFAGAMSGNYLATTDKPAKAADVYVEAVDGGFRIYFLDGETKTYLDIYEYTEGKVGVHLTAEPTAVYTFNAEMGIYTANVAGNDYYLGTYKTYDTISASKTDYITGDNAANVGISQFVAQLSTLTPAVYVTSAVEAPAVDTAYKFAFEQANLGKTLYFAGAMSGNYFATTDKPAKAADVYVEAVDGGFRIYFLDGETKTYLDIYEYTEGKVGVRLTAEPTAVYTFNADIGIYIANVAGNDYYLGTYKTYDTISASKTDYITGDNAANVGVSQFVAQMSVVTAKAYSVNAVSEPAADTAYKFALTQVNLGQTLYFAGAMSGNYLATTDKLSRAADVYAEQTDGGYRLYFLDGETKTYIDIYEYTEGKVGVRITTEPTAVFAFNPDTCIFTANVIGTDYYLGTYKTYNTISASKTDYITGDNAANVGVSQFVAQLSTIDVAD